MNLHHLWVFHHVAREGNFTRAAASLHVSQPAVSEQVRALEGELGINLVELTGRTTRLTAEGQELAEHARSIFALVTEAEEAMQALRRLDSGRLRVAASTTPGTYLLPGYLRLFRQQHPRVELRVQIGNSAQVMDLVAGGEADVAIAGGAVQEHPELNVAAFRADPFLVVAPPGHPLAGRPGVTAADLVAHAFLFREAGSGSRAVFRQWLLDQGHVEPTGLQLGSTEAVKNAAIEGLGLAALSAMAVRRELADGGLVALDLAGPPLGRHLVLVQRRRRPPPALQEFLRLLNAAE